MMRLLLTLVLGASLAFPVSTIADPITFTIDLTGTAEVPPNSSPGSGSARVTIDPDDNTLALVGHFENLVGTTTAMHFHCCTAVPFRGTAGVATRVPSFTAFPLGVRDGTFDFVVDLLAPGELRTGFVTAIGGTPQDAVDALFAGLLEGRAYLNIHTTFRPAGEIRGFIAEPSSLALAALALVALGWASQASRMRAARQAFRFRSVAFRRY